MVILKRGLLVTMKVSNNFSLIETALVLFIGCLVISSLIVGSSLTEQAKLRSLIAEVSGIRIRVADFEAIYDYKPGDFPHASDFWGVDTCGGRVYGSNGDGNGLISYGQSEVQPNRHDAIIESYTAWCHMAMANMGPPVEVITKMRVTPVAGVNLPKTSMGGVFHFMSGKFTNFGLDDHINVLIVGEPAYDMSRPKSLLTPRQAHAIDLQMDNGNPLAGNVRAASGSDAINDCVVNGVYNKKHYDEKLCIMAFILDDFGPTKEDAVKHTN